MSKKVINTRKRSKALSEVKPIKNPFRLKENKPSHRNCLNQLSHPRLSHMEQGCPGFDSRKDSR